MLMSTNATALIKRDWIEFKKLLDGTEKKLSVNHENQSDSYEIFAIDNGIFYKCFIYLTDKEPAGWIQEQIDQNTTDRTDFETNYKPNSNKSQPQTINFIGTDGLARAVLFDDDGKIRTTSEIPPGVKCNIMSVNWCDKCSWYEGSTKVTNETLTEGTDGLIFTSDHINWIDLKHGRVTFEDIVLAENPNKFIVTITSDGVAMTESLVGTISGDYQVDYPTGTITFNSSQAGKVVVATYWYAVSGVFTVKPNAGKRLQIMYVEVQFSNDIILNDTMVFVPYGYAGVFAPQYVPTPFAASDLIPLQAPYKYKTRNDFVNESNGTYPSIPAFGGGGWRGSTQAIITLPWRYLTKTELSSAAGMEIRITMENNMAQGGEMATATFYCVENDE